MFLLRICKSRTKLLWFNQFLLTFKQAALHVTNKRCFLSQGRHHVMMLESTATVLSPREDAHTVLIKDQPALVKYPKTGNPSLMLNTVCPYKQGSAFPPQIV